MKLHSPRACRPRSAFTMIELLVVIAIISILAALLLSAAMKVKVTADIARVVTEIRQLDEACEKFKETYGDYPPSMIILREDGLYNPNNPMELYSKNYLESIFRGINLVAIPPGNPNARWHDWDGDGSYNQLSNRGNLPGIILQGDECLVYFLGGIPRFGGVGVGYALDGFNSDKANPTLPGAASVGRPRISSYGGFDSSRLAYQGDSRVAARWAGYPANYPFPVYLDKWEIPYAYFKAVKGWSTDNYYGCQRNTPPVSAQVLGAFAEFPLGMGDNDGDGFFNELNDCPTLCSNRFIPYWETPVIVPGGNVWPTTGGSVQPFDWISIPPMPGAQPGGRTRFHKPDRFQIVSAGIDKAFGVGGPAPPPQGGPDPNNPAIQDIFEFDRDNLTNFAGGKIDDFRR